MIVTKEQIFNPIVQTTIADGVDFHGHVGLHHKLSDMVIACDKFLTQRDAPVYVSDTHAFLKSFNRLDYDEPCTTAIAIRFNDDCFCRFTYDILPGLIGEGKRHQWIHMTYAALECSTLTPLLNTLSNGSFIFTTQQSGRRPKVVQYDAAAGLMTIGFVNRTKYL